MPGETLADLVRSNPRLRQKLKRGNVRVPRPLFPSAAERAYVKLLTEWAAGLEADTIPAVMQALHPALAEIEARSIRTDVADWTRALTIAMQRAGAIPEPAQMELDKTGAAVAKWNAAQIRRMTRAVFGVSVLAAEPDLRANLDAWRIENVNLITRLKADTFSRIAEAARQGVEEGRPAVDIKRQLVKEFQITSRHAELIARDQVGKLNGQLTMKRQQNLGIDRYRWHTAGDNRVRSTHRAHEGQVYSWAEPPAGTGHPGQDYQCRCFAEAIIPEFDDAGISDAGPYDYSR